MYKAYIYLFCLLCALSPYYASSGGNRFTCDDNLMFDGKIHSSAKVTLIKSLDENLGLFKINNQSDIGLEITMVGKQGEYYRHSMFWGYLYMYLSEQQKGWLKTGVYYEKDEKDDEASSTLGYEKFDYDKGIIIPPKGSLEFITLLWPKSWMKEMKNKGAVRLYMNLLDKEGHRNLIISEPYCL